MTKDEVSFFLVSHSGDPVIDCLLHGVPVTKVTILVE